MGGNIYYEIGHTGLRLKKKWLVLWVMRTLKLVRSKIKLCQMRSAVIGTDPETSYL